MPWKKIDQEALDLWRQSFNYERPHESLGMKCPAELYRPSERKYEGAPQDLDYAQMSPRRVSTSGAIKFEGQSLFLSSALAGWSVGLKPITGDRLEVWFGRLLLGHVLNQKYYRCSDCATAPRHLITDNL
jgi:putative transposase